MNDIDVCDVGDIAKQFSKLASYIYSLYADAYSFSCLLGKFLQRKYKQTL